MMDEKSDPNPPLRLVKKGRPRGRQVGVKIVLPSDLLEDIRAEAKAKHISIAQEIRCRLALFETFDPNTLALGKAVQIILNYAGSGTIADPEV